MSAKRRAIGIVRVSQVGGREGESFASPGEQLERIKAACKRDGLRLVEVFEELDVSGGTPLDRRTGLRTAIEAVEGGKAEVVIAAYLDRLCRSLKVQAELVERVERAGGQVLAVDVGAVTEGTAGQWLSSTMLGAVSEYATRTARERSGDAQRRAVERGVAPFPNIPAGYRRGADGVMVPDSTEAPVVAEFYRLRADGASINECRDHLKAHRIERTWRACQHMLKSRVVLGEIHFGKLHNLTAHEPIVDAVIWQRAQRTELRGPKAKSPRLLARLDVLRCASCGGRMCVHSQTPREKTYWHYRCSPNSDCQQRQSIGADIAECVIVKQVRAALANVEGRASAESNIMRAELELAKAEDALSGAVAMLTGLEDVAGTRERLSDLRQARDDAQARLDQLGGTRAAVAVSAATDWELLTLDEQRALIRATVERATVSPGRGAERVSVSLFTQ
jgi:DNA invertase Pin-like site-specific DNA recombinase